jgi:hypothetical protein
VITEVPIKSNSAFVFSEKGKRKKLEKESSNFRLLFLETPKKTTAYFMSFISDDDGNQGINKSTYLKKDKAFNGYVFYYNLNGGFIIGEKVKNGKRIAYATKAKPNNNRKVEGLKEDLEQTYTCYTTTIEQGYQLCYSDAQTHALIWCDDPVWEIIEEYTWCIDNGGGDGGGEGPINPNPCGGGGGSDGPITIDVADPNDPNNPAPPPCDVNPPPLAVDSLIVEFCQQLTSQNKLNILSVINSFNTNYGDLKSCANQYVYDKLSQNNVAINFCIDQNIVGASATYDPLTSTINFASSQTILLGSLSEEFFHSYQNIEYGGIQNMQTAATGYYHIEFEHALYRDFLDIKGGTSPSNLITYNNSINQGIKEQYINWMTAILQSGSNPISSSNLNVIGFSYNYFLGEFEKMRSGVSATTPANFTPSAMFNLFTNLNCN